MFVASLPTDVPASWWDTRDDRHLLFGCFKHGVGEWADLLSDPSLCFAAKVAPPEKEKKDDGEKKDEEKKKDEGEKKEEGDVKSKEKNADGKYIWPGSKLVNIRLRKLLKHIETWRKTQDKAKKRITAKKKQAIADPKCVPYYLTCLIVLLYCNCIVIVIEC